MTRRRASDRYYPPSERELYGAIATLVDTVTGAVEVVHEHGCSTVQATRAFAARCDTLGPSWRVRTISHPLSILNDLDNGGQARGPHVESNLLGKIGRPDLIEWRQKYTGLRTQVIRARRRKD